MKKTALLAAATLLTLSAEAFADDIFKGRLPAVGANCRGNTHYDIEATVAGDKVEGTLNGSAFRNPAKFSGSVTDKGFTANIVFQSVANLRADIAAERAGNGNYAATVKFNGGGPSNCEGSSPLMRG